MKPNVSGSEIEFSVEQYEYLRKLYPHRVLGPEKSEAEMHHYMGTQKVLASMKEKVRGVVREL